jgi:HTH-type transcriptional regulator, transcriptional repressor of NAD biosynthesis genes
LWSWCATFPVSTRRHRFVPDIGFDDDSAVWADYTRLFLPGAPDVVFTSEAYGETFARCLECRHVCVDNDRVVVPVSGTAVRTRPAENWHHLSPPVRAGMTKRVAIVGAASTGTTTLARELARHFSTEWVPEYGRAYSVEHHRDGELWSTAEFTVIARTQQQHEDDLARRAGPLLFCDTDALATTVWHAHYVGGPCPEVEQLAAARPYTAYVLTGAEIPFEDDGTRDSPHLRTVMQEQFRAKLGTRAEPWIEVAGDVATRVAAVERFLLTVVGPTWMSPQFRA